MQEVRESRSPDGGQDSTSLCRQAEHHMEMEPTRAWTTPEQDQSRGRAEDAMSEQMKALLEAPLGALREAVLLVGAAGACTWGSSRDSLDLDASLGAVVVLPVRLGKVGLARQEVVTAVETQ